MTTPDDPAYENKPSDWNKAHLITANMVGSEISGAFTAMNGISFGMNGANISASYTVPDVSPFLTTAMQSNAGSNFVQANAVFAGTNASGTIASNGISVSVAAGGGGNTGFISAGTNTASLGTVVFADGGGVSFGANGQTITASHNGLTSQSNQALSAANGSFTFQTAQYSNAHGVSFLTSAGSAIAASVETSYAASNHSHGDPTLALTNLSGTTASNSAGFTLSLSAGVGGGGNFSAGVSNVGNTGGDTGVSGTRLVLVGSQNITLNQATDANGLTVSFSGGAGAAGNTGFISAGTNTASLGTVVFADGNGVSFGANGQTITASHNGITSQTVQPVAISGSNGSFAFSTVTFGALNGLSFYTSNGSVVGSYTVPSQTVQPVAISGSNGSFAFSTVTFGALNGLSFYTSNGSMVGSHNALTSQSNQAASASNGSFTFQTLNFSDANNVTWGTSAGGIITASVAAGGGGAFTAGMSTGGNTAGTTGLVSNQLLFVGSGPISLSQSVNGQSATLSIIGPATSSLSATGALSASSNGSTISLGVGTVTASAASNTTQASSGTINLNGLVFAGAGGASVGISNGSVVISGATGGGVSPAASASNGSFAFTTLNFSNANNVTWGTSAGGIITASVAAPGAAAENNNVNLLGANTSGNTTASGSTLGFSGINLTLSGTNASQIVFSAPPLSSLSATGQVSISTNGSTISIGVPNQASLNHYLEAAFDREWLAAQIGNNQLFVQPMALRNNYVFEEVCIPGIFTATSNSSNSATLSLKIGIYTRNANTLSLVTSASASYAATLSGTVGSYSIYGGVREFPIGLTTTLTAGNYYIGLVSRTTTGGGAGMTWSNLVASNFNSAYSGRWSSANNATNQFVLGAGSYATTTTGIPSAIGFTDINGSAAANLRPFIYKLVSGDLN